MKKVFSILSLIFFVIFSSGCLRVKNEDGGILLLKDGNSNYGFGGFYTDSNSNFYLRLVGGTPEKRKDDYFLFNKKSSKLEKMNERNEILEGIKIYYSDENIYKRYPEHVFSKYKTLAGEIPFENGKYLVGSDYKNESGAYDLYIFDGKEFKKVDLGKVKMSLNGGMMYYDKEINRVFFPGSDDSLSYKEKIKGIGIGFYSYNFTDNKMEFVTRGSREFIYRIPGTNYLIYSQNDKYDSNLPKNDQSFKVYIKEIK